MTRLNRRVRCDDRGYSVIELLLAASLMVVILALVGPMMLGPSKQAGRLTDRMVAQTRARDVLDPVIRRLKAAEPLGHCREDGPSTYTTPPDQCIQKLNKHVEQLGAAVISATASSLCFYAQADQRSTASALLTAPDQICVQASTAAPYAVSVTYWKATSTAASSYTTCAPASVGSGCWSSPSKVRYFGQVSNSSIFTYYDNGNNVLAAPVSAANLPNIALVDVNLSVITGRLNGSGNVDVGLHYLAALRGVRYRTEQSPGAPF
ncbi:MAG TPA: hypothetical protein VHD87_15330 [Acidimicrobiales bacterium]|nr:hypothetical protein [Acidimicrobiales bacterium]